MITRTLRTCLGLLLAASWAGGTWVSVAAQAGSPKTPAATSAQQKPPVVPPAQKKAAPAPAPKTAPAAKATPTASVQKATRPAAAPTSPAAPAPQAAPAAVPATPAPATPAAPAADRPPTAESTYTYKSEGRRDPFMSLVNRASIEKGPPQKRPEGLRGLSFDEISLRGVFMGRSGPIALVQGPDMKSYQVHVGDRMYDAVVKAITPDSLVALQEVNDPLSLQKQRERRKTLRVAEEVK